MLHSFDSAKSLAEKYRYTGDKPLKSIRHFSNSADGIKKLLASSGLQVTESITPKLYESLKTACKNLNFPLKNVSAFVYSSPELQAQCFESEEENCVINVSSGLINLLNPNEVTFVIGHEIGHHILGHNQEEERRVSAESFIGQRAKEISVDRAGLIACQSLESSLRAIMKVISGLPDEFIRFDTSNFINQLRAADRQGATLQDSLATHPSLVLRARALLWFSMNCEIPLGHESGSMKLKKINELVRRDLDRYIDKPVREKIKTAEDDLYFWSCVKTVTLKGKLLKEDREKLSRRFGEGNVNKLISAVSEMSIDEVAEFINQKIRTSSQELARIVPDSINERIKAIDKNVDKLNF